MSSQLDLYEKPLDEIKREWIEDKSSRVPLVMGHGAPFTSDDLHCLFGAAPHRNWWGVLMAQLKHAGLVERVGYRPSERKEANGRVVSVWKVK